MMAINGSLGLLRVRASLFTQLPIILCEGWTRTCSWIAGRNKKKVLSSMMVIGNKKHFDPLSRLFVTRMFKNHLFLII